MFFLTNSINSNNANLLEQESIQLPNQENNSLTTHKVVMSALASQLSNLQTELHELTAKKIRAEQCMLACNLIVHSYKSLQENPRSIDSNLCQDLHQKFKAKLDFHIDSARKLLETPHGLFFSGPQPSIFFEFQSPQNAPLAQYLQQEGFYIKMEDLISEQCQKNDDLKQQQINVKNQMNAKIANMHSQKAGLESVISVNSCYEGYLQAIIHCHTKKKECTQGSLGSFFARSHFNDLISYISKKTITPDFGKDSALNSDDAKLLEIIQKVDEAVDGTNPFPINPCTIS
jgi:hypothetical protein